MRRKQLKPKAIWSIDLKYERADGPAKYPLYEIYLEEGLYSVKYHGCCEIHTSKTLESAKEFCEQDLEHRCNAVKNS